MKLASPADRSAFLLTLDSMTSYWIPLVSPFSLKLPEESQMLAVVCDLYGAYALNRQPLPLAQEMVRGFVTSDADLERLIGDANVDVVIKARCALLLLVLSENIHNFERYHRELILSSISSEPKLVRVLIWTFALLNVLQREEVQSIASEVLEKCRGTTVWYSMESFFAQWREVSHAPIAASSILDEYLAWSSS